MSDVYEIVGEHEGKDVNAKIHKVNDYIKYEIIYYNKESNYCTYSENEGNMDSITGGTSSIDVLKKLLKTLTKIYQNLLISKSKKIKYVDNEKDVEANIFQKFMLKNISNIFKKFYLNLRIDARIIDDNKCVEIQSQIFAKIDNFLNKTKYIKNKI